MIDHTLLNQPALAAIAGLPRWTVLETGSKKPLHWGDYEHEGRLRGCRPDQPEALTTLDHIVEYAHALNTAYQRVVYYHDVEDDGLVIVDMENNDDHRVADTDRDRLLALPYVYGERSMRDGWHLLVEADSAMMDAAGWRRGKLVSPDQGYEIMLSHPITFTGRTLDPPDNPGGTTSMVEEIGRLAATARQRVSLGVHVNPQGAPSVDRLPHGQRLVDKLVAHPYRMKPEDFMLDSGKPDYSRWEFGCLSHHYRFLAYLLCNDLRPEREWAAAGIARQDALYSILDRVARTVWPPRPKKHSQWYATYGSDYVGMTVQNVLDQVNPGYDNAR